MTTQILTRPLQDNTPVRFAIALPAGVVATGLILTLMVSLVVTEFAAPPDKPVPNIPDITWKEPEKIETIRDRPKPPEDQKQEPPKIDPVDQVDPGRQVVTIPSVSPTIETGHDSAMRFDNNMPIAIVLGAPRYPRRAAQLGIEGYVDVMFDVTAKGSVENIRVLGAQPQGTFEEAAVSAVERWKFQPPTVDGKPQPFSGMTNRVTFKMAE